MQKCLTFLITCVLMVNCQFGGFRTTPFFASWKKSPIDSSFFSGFGLDKMDLDFFDNFGKPSDNIDDLQERMEKGMGGTTLVVSPDKVLIMKDATLFECLAPVISRSPFCMGNMRRFQIQKQKDFCYSNNYSRMKNVLCIGHNDQNGLTFNNNNGRYACRGSDERQALLINIHDYQRMCGALPWEKTYYYYPDNQNPFHVPVPNPKLNCTDKMCAFHPLEKSAFGADAFNFKF